MAKVTEEELDSMGQESETKAAKWVKEKGKEYDKETEKEDAIRKEILTKRTKFDFMDYKRTLAQTFDYLAWQEEFPEDWLHHIAITDKGLVMYLRSPEKEIFYRAFSPVNDPNYDMPAIMKILESSWVAIEKWRDAKNVTESGIIKPNGRTAE